MELPDPRCPISTSTHKPETTTTITLSLYALLRRIQCNYCEKSMVSKYNDFTLPFTWVAKLNAVNFVLEGEQQHGEWLNRQSNWKFNMFSVKEHASQKSLAFDGALTVCSWSSDTFSGLPLPTKYILMTSSVLPVARNMPPEKNKTLKVFQHKIQRMMNMSVLIRHYSKHIQ